MWIPALRRFAVLVGAIGGGTVIVSILFGLLLGASLPRSIALGYYLVGSFLLLAGFFFGNRGPVRPRSDDDQVGVLARPRGRRVRWATREEHEEAINSFRQALRQCAKEQDQTQRDSCLDSAIEQFQRSS